MPLGRRSVRSPLLQLGLRPDLFPRDAPSPGHVWAAGRPGGPTPRGPSYIGGVTSRASDVTPPQLYSVSSLAARDSAAHELPRSRLRSLQLTPSIAARLHGELALITPPDGGLLVLLAAVNIRCEQPRGCGERWLFHLLHHSSACCAVLAAAPAAPHSSSSRAWTQQSTPYLLLVDVRTPPTVTRTLLVCCSERTSLARCCRPPSGPS